MRGDTPGCGRGIFCVSRSDCSGNRVFSYLSTDPSHVHPTTPASHADPLSLDTPRSDTAPPLSRHRGLANVSPGSSAKHPEHPTDVSEKEGRRHQLFSPDPPSDEANDQFCEWNELHCYYITFLFIPFCFQNVFSNAEILIRKALRWSKAGSASLAPHPPSYQ